jgi:hypothetical protein
MRKVRGSDPLAFCQASTRERALSATTMRTIEFLERTRSRNSAGSSTQIFTVNVGRNTFARTLFVVVPTNCFSTGP